MIVTLYLNFCRRVYELCIAFPENHTMTLLKNIAKLFIDSAIEIRQVTQHFSCEFTSFLGHFKWWRRSYE